ncbi:MAG: geranylgeranylglycerol-phosphate geranylgeranyltransferase [Bacteroidota bacterium]|nr:geranylgeranylglycerol-phosphate geranylgeranyltransferase [Bacteroidota bacterium]
MNQTKTILQNPLIAFLKLIRFENILIVVITQYLIRYCVIDSLLFYKTDTYFQKLSLQLTPFTFFLLTLSTALIAAAGYIINDYFDLKTDKINHPDTVVLDKTIKRRWALVIHVLFSALGILIALYVAYKAGNVKLALIHVLTTGLLWYYSTSFKKQLLIGNIIVSLLSAMVPLTVMLFEMPKVIEIYRVMMPYAELDFSAIYKFILAFSLFAFISSLIREIIKDMEDVEGDLETGCNTVPIAWGLKASKAIVIGLITNMILILLFIVYNLYGPKEKLPSFYIVFGLIFPLIYLITRIYKAQGSKDFHWASIFIKFIMLIGVCFSFIIYYLAKDASY